MKPINLKIKILDYHECKTNNILYFLWPDTITNEKIKIVFIDLNKINETLSEIWKKCYEC